MTFEQIRTDVSDGVMTITLDRPERLNAWTQTMGRELIAAFDHADDDDDVRAVIVTGSGRAFCAGADLAGGEQTFDRRAPGGEQPAGGRATADERSRGAVSPIPRDGGGTLTLRIFESTKPVIAAINGPAVGVGATMTLPMDIRLASDTARFGFVFTRRGIVPEAASSWFLPRIVGISRALEWTLSGRLFDAQEAQAAGLVRSLHPPEQLLDAARTAAGEITASTAPVSVALARRMLWTMLGANHPMQAHRADSRGMLARGGSADAAEGVRSFLDKRSPEFPDRVSDGLPPVLPDWTRQSFY